MQVKVHDTGGFVHIKAGGQEITLSHFAANRLASAIIDITRKYARNYRQTDVYNPMQKG